MRVLIIGGTNFIGPYVVRRLVDAGHELTVFSRRLSTAALPPEVRRIVGDRRQLASFRDEFKRLKPEVVLDMIPYTEEEARSVMRTCRGVAARVVAVSSMDVYRAYALFRRDISAPLEPGPFDEEAPLRNNLYMYRSTAKGPEDWVYHYEKILVERVVMSEQELPGTVLRLAKLYGSGNKPDLFSEYVTRMDDRRPVILLDEKKAQWRWTRGYVDDVAAGITLAVTNEQAANRIYNLGEAEALTEAEWIQSIGEVAGWQGRIITMPEELLPEHLREPYDWTCHLVADTSRVREELSYREVATRGEALEQIVAWERARSPVDAVAKQLAYDAEDTALRRLEATANHQH